MVGRNYLNTPHYLELKLLNSLIERNSISVTIQMMLLILK